MPFGIEDDEDEIRRRFGVGDDSAEPAPKIARPNITSQPALAIRGVSPPAASPLQKQTSTDQAELSRLNDTGSGITQIKNPFARGGLRGLNIAGEVASSFLPQIGSALHAIPGTEEHHQSLINRQQGIVGQDIGLGEKEAQTAHARAQVPFTEAQTDKTQAETDAIGQPKPKEESYKPYPNFTDSDGTPLKIEETSGKVLRADGGIPTGFKAAKPEQPFQTRDVTRVVHGVPHSVMVDAQTGNDVKDLGQTKVPGETPGDKRSAAESVQVEREARTAVHKAEQEYNGALSTVAMQRQLIQDAKGGNKAAVRIVPLEGALQITTSQGVHRINRTEVEQYGQAGSLYDRIVGSIGSGVSGQSIPDNVLSDMDAMTQELQRNAHERYQREYNYNKQLVEGYGGKDFDKRVPMTPQGNTEPHGGQGNTPAGATMKVPGSDGKLHWSDGKQDLGVVQ